MKKLLLVLTLALCALLAGCENRDDCNIYWHEDCPIETTTTETTALYFLDNCDFYLLTVVDRRNSGDGYEYIFQADGEETTEDWFFSDELFSIGEYVLGIEYGSPEEFVLYDLN